MVKTKKHLTSKLEKSPTGIQGFDEITEGGVPKGRPTLICGGPGCGKTLFAMEFLVRGATMFHEPGIFVAFEENSEELTQNVSSLGFHLEELSARKKIILDYIYIDRSEIEVTGEYDLEGLFVRLGYLIDSIGAKRVVLDTLESLFANLPNEAILRAELRRLFRWLKEKGVTAVITAERGDRSLTRYGLEEYVSDCVVLLEHIVIEQVATRRLRIVKYRGSSHGTNEYPFLIDRTGISVLPITSLELKHTVTSERISTGIERLDVMLEGRGYYAGSSILVSGTAGTGKTSIAAHFANSVSKNGQKCLYLAFEESENQIIRNMHSIGLNLGQWVNKGLLQFHATRPTFYGIEMHLVKIHDVIQAFNPDVVIFDPITNLITIGGAKEVKSMLTRLIDFLKEKRITILMTNLSHQGTPEETEIGISSLVDTWILLQDIEMNGERNRGMYILKSRGMAHSNQVREFLLTPEGIKLQDVYIGEGQVFMGSSRLNQEARDRANALLRKQEIERKQRDLERKRELVESQIAALHAQFQTEEEELKMAIEQEKTREDIFLRDRKQLLKMRKGDIEAVPLNQKGKKE
ncbi:MAG: circadian clock protein KaiC [Candidatus Jettenia sp.]|uniref:non-specific serine/threonine protein kinase n=1 Tax=Candidatus Jettenia caeni TaxID=247490 RepID=I3IPL9_9BACT|nr:circadian clock protein KaiC [Candidatus Jettenia sp. AMX1]MBC6930415.1 circadian clock protein KaiC [Candidatus Jettenia sp.]NUO10453.1 circadian clock protein KaiC [Candidatus Brocadia sp.]WKZ16113.1 MAG: circadian clock protein KaiC [Candidatus Jettenia caeni]KAA0247363.1 MAG: circadian clock protein KaiC [Candidatus Jettenia sp. AMX1]MCQ3928725.1 AAA family ATPase [Candidatus Jettenia sp.]